MATYVPRVSVCGDVEKFKKIIGDKPVEIVDDEAEYLIFTDPLELDNYLENSPLNTQVMSAVAFAKKISDGFFSYKAFAVLNKILGKNFGRVLDFDGCFAKSDFNLRGDFKTKLDCVGKNLYPILENVYDKIYKAFDECKFHIYDAIIFSKERTPEEFIDAMIQTNDVADKILLFVRKNSALENWLTINQNIFAQIESFKVENGAWCLIKKIMPPADVGIYIVTHKDVKLSKLPKCYRIIHAGHVRAKNDFGYIGDDSGDNISRLNPFLDEVTALYWIWKNTNHTHAGFVHYRRFFTSNLKQKEYRPGEYVFNAKNLLSEAEILKILSEYDIIVHTERLSDRTQLELMIYSTKFPELVELSEKVVRKHLTKNQPDYLDSYDAVFNGFVCFLYGMHITRRNILNAYCEWLFSFMLDATEELSERVKIGDTKLIDAPHVYSRMMSFFSERMLTVWLKKNHLKIKTLPIMYRDDI
ncbi:MAG: DUF4422 domain-containing protein [Selenomonadaceae bacterium]|nr:DUF4422 domain-containing protein [Selenomonadaceae bacterium]